MTMRYKQRAFVEEYLQCWNATEAARRAGYSQRTARSIGSENLTKPDIAAEIQRRIDEKVMSANEVLVRLADYGRSDMGDFFQLVEEWTAYPLPSYEILGAEERVIDDETKEKKVFYWVRHVTIDMDRLVDPRYSYLVKKFTDSPKNGLSLELHDAKDAIVRVGQHHRLFTEKAEVDVSLRVDGLADMLDKIYGPAKG